MKGALDINCRKSRVEPLKMMGSFITRGIIMGLGYICPAYECYKVVDRPRADLENLRFWCQYWMIIAVVTVLERLGDIFISWMPMYCEAKLAFIIYLWYSKTMGTTCLYSKLLKPFVAKHESEIDHNLNELKTRAGEIALVWWQKWSIHVQARFHELLQFLARQSDRAQEGARGSSSRSHALNIPRGLTQGALLSHPPPPPPGITGSPAASYPSSQGSQAGQRIYPPPLSHSTGVHVQHQLRPLGIFDGEGDSDHDVVEYHLGERAEHQSEERLERLVPSAGGQNLPPGVQNTRIRLQTDSPGNLSIWLPAWLGSTAPKKVDLQEGSRRYFGASYSFQLI
ncbi:uncharacterized protein [Physcomitrium patens]|uniref:uncharacterized protein isoform X2 n=1 Tax=Physcomitrium patens TaxID=3218 RepID=UPI003CCD6BBF